MITLTKEETILIASLLNAEHHRALGRLKSAQKLSMDLKRLGIEHNRDHAQQLIADREERLKDIRQLAARVEPYTRYQA